MAEKTQAVIAFFIAALAVAALVRLFVVTEEMTCAAKKETFMNKEVGAPLDAATDKLWSLDYAPTPAKAYEVADDTQLFAFQNTPMRPECCPSQITGAGGCACLTKEQEAQLALRGGNRVGKA